MLRSGKTVSLAKMSKSDPETSNINADENKAESEHGPGKTLEIAIGRQVRSFRKRLNLTVANVARQAQMSSGMLSKIENGLTSPSLATMSALADALHVPVTALFRGYEEQRDVTVIKAGEGLPIERRGSGAGHEYQLLGHTIGKPYTIEPYLITLSDISEVFPIFQHAGTELIYMLEGKVTYRHGDKSHLLEPGDSMFFDAEASHGPDEILELPCRYLSIIVSQSLD
ncbi:MAG: helix-turn-helix domain-containing protein [Gammaproteobacteria bacterium]|nr:helix-turn-helix domain-containing protein [Gammaproteobacteria bacterium]